MSQMMWWAQIGSRRAFEEERMDKFIKALVRRAMWKADNKASRVAARFGLASQFDAALLDEYRRLR